MEPSIRTEQLQLHAAILRDLSRRGHWHKGDRDRAFRELCQVAAQTLELERASIWIYDESRTRIICADLYERSSDHHSAGQELCRVDYPAYFDALGEARTIAADDARTDPQTREFSDSYLKPLGISSMLDAPILAGGVCVGVVCQEHVGAMRTWTQEEESFAASLGDFAALTIEAEQRRGAEDRLRERDQELRLALDAASMGTWMLDLASGRIEWSDQVARIFGKRTDWTPKRPEDYLALVHPEDREMVAASLKRLLGNPDLPHQLQHRIVVGDESTRWVEIRGQAEPGGAGERRRILGTISDHTETRELESQLVHSQKLEGLGQLAGGIAHDFNNLLTVMSGYTEILLADPTLDADQRNSAGFIADACNRAAALTGQLLAFSRRQPVEISSVDVNDLIAGLSDLLRRLIGERVNLQIQLGPPAIVRVDVRQIEQVLINLSINARDAMPGGGTLTVSSTSVGRVQTDTDASAPGGRQVCISVSDTGVGIAEDTLPRIFEPFFTTKPIGKGTGLGLSTCYGIAKRAGGDLLVRSRIGEGTTFSLVLPEATDFDEKESVPIAVPKKTHAEGETILVVEDDDLVRRLVVSVLEREGYRIMEAADGEEAIAIARAQANSLDLVVADLVLPGQSGDRLVDAIRHIRPRVAALYISGYAADAAEGDQSTRGDDLPPGEFLQKPFSGEDLTRRVRGLLDRDA
jgi:two-component system cell cycle sensor histidine kinase/response regulator CckA